MKEMKWNEPAILELDLANTNEDPMNNGNWDGEVYTVCGKDVYGMS